MSPIVKKKYGELLGFLESNRRSSISILRMKKVLIYSFVTMDCSEGIVVLVKCNKYR